MERLFKAIYGAIMGALMSLVSIGTPIYCYDSCCLILQYSCRRVLFLVVWYLAWNICYTQLLPSFIIS